MRLPAVLVNTKEMIYFSFEVPVAELRAPVFQPSLMRHDSDTDSGIGFSTDDRSSSCGEEVSKVV